MKKELFTGSAVALVTPMHADGSINYDTLGKLVDYHLQNGTDAIVACATTGESPVLSHEEHCKVVEFIVKRVAKKIPVIASSGSNNTAYALELSKDLQSVGADGLLMITPYYNKTSQVGFVKHFTYIADHVDLPIILYNIPSRTGCNIMPETYFELSKHPNIVGTKEANGDLAAAAKTAALCGENLAIYSGEDNLTLPILSIGGKGVISTSANIIPKVMSDICHLDFQGNEKESRQLFLKYLDVMNTLFIDVNPMPVKAAMNMVGWDCGKCRLPLTEISKENEAKLRQTLQKYGLLA
ncbi:4-hydroxy-tetrahydrodipicolinate synthase [Thermocaproicibacter melissae]|uniref:4-hydroxy-tetrahydrodipicolinate synthase n=1 Tax=Thermocaproicibacter melissae TaxID=2966552 RepID=UPI0024B0A3DF|nr:4-hydroxy-tetrahydrodipicolinate synthase [Thermocaproicibacter melissae]WBY64798.1 4-hydroxy-tetrahydrodipicolinate synthase [Thermocaproicibacter melissae]